MAFLLLFIKYTMIKLNNILSWHYYNEKAFHKTFLISILNYLAQIIEQLFLTVGLGQVHRGLDRQPRNFLVSAEYHDTYSIVHSLGVVKIFFPQLMHGL